jgi:hypothetical protein
VSTPLAPRTVRTIDLAAPVMAATPAAVPVLAASPDDSAEETDAEVG